MTGAFVDRRTPLLCAQEEHERMLTAERARNEWIVAARAEGWTVDEIADELGVTEDVVALIGAPQ